MKNPPAELCKFRKAIEDEFKVHPETKQDYITLAHKINEKLKTLGGRGEYNKAESISEETIYKVWEYRKNNEAIVSPKTLGILARSIDYLSWGDFIEKYKLKSNEIPESFTPELIETVSAFFNPELIDVPHIKKDEEVHIGWSPYKYAILRCIGEYEFAIIEEKNMYNKKGFTFLTTGFHLSPKKKEFSIPDIIFEPFYDDLEDEHWTLSDLTTIPKKYYL